MLNDDRSSVLFICKRVVDDPVVIQVSRELGQAIVRALEHARTH